MMAHHSLKTHCFYHSNFRAWVPRQSSEKKPTKMSLAGPEAEETLPERSCVRFPSSRREKHRQHRQGGAGLSWEGSGAREDWDL